MRVLDVMSLYGHIEQTGPYSASNLHFDSFAINDSETLSSAKPGVSGYGQRIGMSILDKYKLNAAYNCPNYDPPQCGRLFDLETEGSLQVNPSESSCRWDIIAPRGTFVIVEFHTVQVRANEVV